MRESFYACTFNSRSERRVAHVRAWDLDEAMELFVAELRSEGIVDAGNLVVTALGGGRRSKARFHPGVQ